MVWKALIKGKKFLIQKQEDAQIRDKEISWTTHSEKFHKPQDRKKQTRKQSESAFFCGPGENRTPVQTRKPYAFYMLIFD